MLRHCPLCEHEPLRPLEVSTTVVGTCAHCHGLWFTRGALERFADRPPARVFREAARRAPSRCRKQHLVPMARSECASCHGAPVSCPDCGARMARVVTTPCAADFCLQCEGLWLDAGGFERLEGLTHPRVWPAGEEPLARSRCKVCGRVLAGQTVSVLDGEPCCARCRPLGAR